MDRDDHALSLITPRLYVPSAVPFADAFKHLPREVKMEVIARDALMKEIARAAKVFPAAKKIAGRLSGQRGMSAHNLSDLFYEWAPEPRGHGLGAAALIDHRRCGSMLNQGACGVIGCTRPRSRRGLPPEVVQLYWGKSGKYDKRGMREGWERVITSLCGTEPIAEGITWQTVYLQLYPGLDLPQRCPWSVSNPPPGWSASTFYANKPPRPVYDAIRKGGAAAWLHTPDVRMDLTQLRFLEAVVFDDHRIDIEVMVWDERGKVQTVELWGLFAMDVATGAVIAFGLRPKMLRPDGTAEGLTMRDMQHLIAHILATYGYPTDYKMHLIVENAAAAVSAQMEALLLSRTNGQVIVRRTGVHAGDFVVRGFPERWGAPRGKAILETWFNLLDIALGDLKGQMGSNYAVKPGDHDGRVRIAQRLAAIISAHPEMAEKLQSPLHWAGDAHLLISEAINAINDRTDHAMQRHERVIEWRWSEGDTTPKPLALRDGMPAGIAKEVSAFLALPAAARDVLINNYGIDRMESPAEKVRRIHRPNDFVGVSADTYLDLMMDTARATYKGGDGLDVEIKRAGKKRLLRFVGQCDMLELGQEVSVRYNSDRPNAGAWLLDEREAFLTYLQFRRDPRMLRDDDLPLLQEQLGTKNKAYNAIITEARRVVRSLPEVRQEIADRDRDIATLSTLVLPQPATIAAALPESANLARVVMGTKKPKAAPVVSDADAYLELVGDDDEEN